MTAGRRRYAARAFMTVAMALLLVNLFLYAKGRGNPAFLATGMAFLVIAVAMSARGRRGDSSS